MATSETYGPAHVAQIMGMPIIVDVRDEIDSDAVEAVFGWLREVDETFSTYLARERDQPDQPRRARAHGCAR